MRLADERRSHKLRNRAIDPLVFRVFLALVGTLMLTAAGLSISRQPIGLEWWIWLLVLLPVSLATYLLYVSLFGSNRNVEKWSDFAGGNEVVVLLVLVAFPIAWAIKKAFRGRAT